MAEHWFWWMMTMACVLWYSTITIYVAIKGVRDIKQMLSRLSGAQPERDVKPDVPSSSTDTNAAD